MGIQLPMTLGHASDDWVRVTILNPPPKQHVIMAPEQLRETIDIIWKHCSPFMDPHTDVSEFLKWYEGRAAGELMVHQWLSCLAIDLEGNAVPASVYASVVEQIFNSDTDNVMMAYEEWLQAYTPHYGMGCPLCGTFSNQTGLVRMVTMNTFREYTLRDAGHKISLGDTRELERLYANGTLANLKTSGKGPKWRWNVWVTTANELNRLEGEYTRYPDTCGAFENFIVQSLGLAWEPMTQFVRLDYKHVTEVTKPTAIHRSWRRSERNYFLSSMQLPHCGRTRPTHRDCAVTSLDEYIHLPIEKNGRTYSATRPMVLTAIERDWESVSNDGYKRLKQTVAT